jgi:hypothetical protein
MRRAPGKSCVMNRGLWRSAGCSGPAGCDVNADMASPYCMATWPIAILEHERKRIARRTLLIDGETQALIKTFIWPVLPTRAGSDECGLTIARDVP